MFADQAAFLVSWVITPSQEGGEEGEENTGPEPLKFDVTEVQRLRFMMENIQSGTGLVSG